MRPGLLWSRIALPAALLLAALQAISPACACSVCTLPGIDGLALPDLRILEVAIATRKAIESGVIRAATKGTEDSILAQVPDASLLKFWVMKERAVGPSAEGPVHVLLVDTGRKFSLCEFSVQVPILLCREARLNAQRNLRR